jgi:hypothetical protein
VDVVRQLKGNMRWIVGYTRKPITFVYTAHKSSGASAAGDKSIFLWLGFEGDSVPYVSARWLVGCTLASS